MSQTLRHDLDDHLTKGDGVRPSAKKGVSDTHNKDEFDKLTKQKAENGKPIVKEISKTETTPGSGIYQIKYEVQRKDGKGPDGGNYDGTYSIIKDPKTVYDPKKWPDDKMIKMARHAAMRNFNKHKKEYINSNGRKNQFTTEVGGVKFRVYINKGAHGTIIVGNVHPQ